MGINYSRIKLDLYSKNATKLTDDITKYINLIELDCQNNAITRLDNLPPGLQKLDCQDNAIVRLDNLPPVLQILKCQNNNITSLNNLPLGLLKLYCSNNLLQYDFEPTIENIKNNNASSNASSNTIKN